jgi:hypothetical protein
MPANNVTLNGIGMQGIGKQKENGVTQTKFLNIYKNTSNLEEESINLDQLINRN